MLKEEIKMARNKLGLSQQDFGNLLGVTGKHARSKVNDWELGKTEPNKTAQLILQYILSLYNVDNDPFLAFLKEIKDMENGSFKSYT